MKVRIVKWYNALLTSLIGLLGFSACDSFEPKEEYGSPYVKYTIKGRVTDADGRPLQGIQAEVGENYTGRFIRRTEPIKTDAEGGLTISDEDITADGYSLVLTDTDGEAGGGYFGTDTIALSTLPKQKTEDGKGWYKGAYEYTANVTMTKRNKDGQ